MLSDLYSVFGVLKLLSSSLGVFDCISKCLTDLKFGVFQFVVQILKAFSSILGLVWFIGELWDFIGYCGFELAIYNLINF